MNLTDLYDADRRTRDPVVRDLATRGHIPHPLHGVSYADGRRRVHPRQAVHDCDRTTGGARMTGCQTCGGGMGKHDEAAHGDWGPPGIPWTEPPPDEPCNGMCVMGNEVMPGQPAHQGHDDDPRGGYYDWAAYPHPECPRHGDRA